MVRFAYYVTAQLKTFFFKFLNQINYPPIQSLLKIDVLDHHFNCYVVSTRKCHLLSQILKSSGLLYSYKHELCD